jgi:hypothetical protein
LCYHFELSNSGIEENVVHEGSEQNSSRSFLFVELEILWRTREEVGLKKSGKVVFKLECGPRAAARFSADAAVLGPSPSVESVGLQDPHSGSFVQDFRLGGVKATPD